jgi:hypothetical protein
VTSDTANTRELAAREGDDLRVLLLWHPREDAVIVSVEDACAGDGFQHAVSPDRALDAFYPPFAFAPRAELLPDLAAEPPVESEPNPKPAITANDGRAQLRLTAREHEREARRCFQAAIAVALDSLRRAQARFDESSAAIDVHIHQARAAVVADTRFTLHGPALTAPQPLTSSATSRIRSPGASRWAPQGSAETVPAGSRRTLSPAPSRLFP